MGNYKIMHNFNILYTTYIQIAPASLGGHYSITRGGGGGGWGFDEIHIFRLIFREINICLNDML